MSTKFSDEWGDFEIKVNDPRGQYWLYKDAARTLNIGWGHENPGRGHIHLSDITARGMNSALPTDQLLRSIARFFGFMVKPGGGYSSVQLHLDGGPTVRPEELMIIDSYLARFGLMRQETSSASAPVWTRSPAGHLPPSSRQMH